MAENAGAIVYTVDMDTAAVTKGADRVNAALDSVGKGADRLDGTMGKAGQATDKFGRALSATAKEAGVYIDASGRMREANGRFVTSARQAELGIDAVGKASGEAGGAAGAFTAKLTPLAAVIGGLVSVQALANMGKLAEQFTLLQARITRLSADTATAASTYNRLLSVAAATGQTMPETVKLWETLTSSLKSLGATNDQVVTLTSTLQEIGKIGGSSADETANALRQLGQSLAGGTLRAEEFNSIVEQTPELVRQLAAASGRSMGEFRQAMLDGKITSQELFDLLISRTQAVDTEFKKLPRSASDAANAIVVQMGAALSVIDQTLGASQKLAKVLDGIAEGIRMTFNPSDQEKFNALLQERATAQEQYEVQLKAGLRTTAAATKTRLDGLNAEIKKMQEARIAAIKAEGGGGGTSANKPAATTTTDGQKALDQLAEQNQQLRAQGVERAKIIALQKLGAGATQQEKDAAVALAIENFNLQEAERARNKTSADGAAQRKRDEEAAAAAIRRENEEAKRGFEANQKVIQGLALELSNAALKGEELAVAQAKAKLNKFASPEDVAEVERLTRAIVQQQQVLANKQLAGQVDPFTGAQQQRDQRLKDLQTLEQAELLSVERVNQLKLQAETTYQEQVRALQEETFRQASVGNDILIGTLNQLQQAGTQAFVGLITGASNGQQAVQALASALLNEAVGALVQMGVQYVKNMIIGQTAAAAATATGVATAATLATAYATPAALASLASFGANAAPASAGIASTVALAQGLAIGARQYGGPVAAGNLYRVNEGGAPEIFNAAGGKQYMMPNSRGEVVSNKDATAQSGAPAAPVVNVNNYSGAPATAAAKFSEADKQWVIDVVVGDGTSNGKVGQMIANNTGIPRRGR